jgi:hypothetical protein
LVAGKSCDRITKGMAILSRGSCCISNFNGDYELCNIFTKFVILVVLRNCREKPHVGLCLSIVLKCILPCWNDVFFARNHICCAFCTGHIDANYNWAKFLTTEKDNFYS